MSNEQFAILIAAGGVAAWWLLRQVPAVGEAAADVVQGEVGDPSSPYYGKGIPGTLGTVTNEASGGSLEAAGRAFGSWLFGVLNPEDAKRLEQAKR